MKFFALVFSLCLVLSQQAQAVLVNYWDFNKPLPLALQPTIGNAGASLFYSAVGVSGVTDRPGTDVNLYGTSDPGNSLAFINLVDAFRVDSLTFSDLDFSDLTDVEMTLAVRSNSLFSVGETFTYQYRASPADSWSTLTSWSSAPTSAWTIRIFDFDNALDGATNAQIRLVSTAAFELGDFIEFDNVQITAVPEPSAILLLGIAALALGLMARKRTAH